MFTQYSNNNLCFCSCIEHLAVNFTAAKSTCLQLVLQNVKIALRLTFSCCITFSVNSQSHLGIKAYEYLKSL